MAIGMGHATPSIEDYMQSNLSDATFVAHIIKGDQRELRKINDSFGQSYRFQSTTIRYKEPFMLRLDATVDDTTILYILNGAIQVMKVPRAHISVKQNLTSSPGRRQSALDFGLLVPSLFKSLYSSQFVRLDRATGDPVFDLTYQDRNDTSRSRIWVDPQRHIVAKREWYNQSGRQLATFYYDEPKEENGVWLPTRLTVKNTDDVIAGVTRYDSIQVNPGIPESMFSVDR